MPDEISNLGAVPPPPEKKLPQDRLSTIRTYQGDIQSVVRGDNISMASIALKERARALAKGEEEAAAPSRGRNTILIGLSVFFVLMGITLVSYFAFFAEKNSGPIVDTSIQSLVFADKQEVLDTTATTGDVALRQLRRILAEERTLGTIENIVLSRSVVSTEDPTAAPGAFALTAAEYLRLLAPRAPDAFVRLLNTPFMYGIHGFEKNYGFLLFETNDGEKVYSELLGWERTSLARDIGPLLREDTVLSSGTVALFQDALIKNIDARVIRDQNGEILMIYAFLTPQKVLLAGSEETFIEVLRRFTTPRPVVR